jgi:glycosyltransferase involved in cell wall biosynthesis
MRVINILFNHKTSSGFQRIAGVEKVFLDYSELAIKNGWEVVSVTKPAMSYRKNLIDMGSQLYEINAMGHGDIITMARLGFLMIKFKPNVIICHSGRALFMSRFAARLLKIPLVAVNHGIKIKKFLKADYVFAVNSHFASEVVQLGFDKNRSIVVPNMLEVPDNFVPPADKKFHPKISIGSLGRFCGSKQYEGVIKAVAILKSKGIEVDFLLAGDGDSKERLENLAAEIGVKDNIKFLGWVENKKSFFDKVDIFVLPSLAETFGIALLEAMLYKTPIISGNSYGPRDILENEVDGLIIPTQNIAEIPELLALAVERLINNPDYAKNLAEKAYEKFHQKYSNKVVGKQIKNLLLEIAAPY